MIRKLGWHSLQQAHNQPQAFKELPSLHLSAIKNRPFE